MKKVNICTCLFSGVCFLSSASAISAIRVDGGYGVKNGLTGMMSGVVNRAMSKIPAISKNKAVYGMNQEQLKFRDHHSTFNPVRDQFLIHTLINIAEKIVEKRSHTEFGYEHQCKPVCAQEGPQLLRALLGILGSLESQFNDQDLKSPSAQLHTQISCIRFEVGGYEELTETEKDWATKAGILRDQEITPEDRNCHFVAIAGTLGTLKELLKKKDR